MRPRPQPFPCPPPRPLWGPLLVRKPGHFSRRHLLPRQCKALATNCWWVWQRPRWRRLTLVLGLFWRIFFLLATRVVVDDVRQPVLLSLASSPSSSMVLNWVLECLLPRLSSQSYTSWHSSAILSKFFCCLYSFLICCVRTSLGSLLMKRYLRMSRSWSVSAGSRP